MAFQKVGTFKIAKVEILPSLDTWNEFKKQAKTLPAQLVPEQSKQAVEKEADFQVVATIDTDKFIYVHTTIMSGVKTEDNNFWITAETEKYINDNHDAWTCEDLTQDYKSFRKATTFVEHDQRLEQAKGKCIDATARDMGDTILIDVLFSVDRRHKDLVANIENGIINAVSMGCSTARTICSICGNEATDPENYCNHLRSGNKGRIFKIEGKNRRSAEICKGNTFFDVSLVANPAFAGAIFRKILSSSEVSHHLLANILNSKIEEMNVDNSPQKNASNDTDVANFSIKSDGSIVIKTENKIYTTASKTLNPQEIENMILKTEQNEKSASLLTKIIQNVFGKKEATHPILNQSPNKQFSITDQNYDDIAIRNRFDGLNRCQNNPDCGPDVRKPECQCELEIISLPAIVELDIQKINEEKQSRVQTFECFKCGFTDDLWKIRAASIDAGNKSTIECPRCFFAADISFFKNAKSKFKLKEKVKITGGKEKGKSGVIVSFRGNLVIVKLDSGKAVWKSEADLQSMSTKKANIFVANQDIPVEDDEGTYWFDKQGNAIITKGEKVSFITTVDNGEYGLFQTETGEDFFMPMAFVNKNNNTQIKENDK